MALADLVTHVIGVDTHKDTHTAAAVTAATGAVEQVETAAACRDGYEVLVELADAYSEATDRAWAIEGTGSYGAGLARFLAGRGEWVIEVDRPSRPRRRPGAKSDELDAVRAARDALGQQRWAEPRAGGEREAMRVLLATRESAVRDRTRAVNELKAIIVSAPEELRDRLRRRTAAALVGACGRLRRRGGDVAYDATVDSLRRLARRIADFDAEVAAHDADLHALTVRSCPQLQAEFGVGPITAARCYVAWSHRQRCRNEAAYAQLAGSAPIEASSGQIVRHRLNRGGDRQLNRALHTIVVTRGRAHCETRAYIARRVAQGKTERDARRCLKRYLARHIYRLLETGAPTIPAPTT
jgi:transposase